MNKVAPAGEFYVATDWTGVFVAALCGVAVAMNVGKVPIAMDQLRQEFGLSLVAAGWVASIVNTLAVFTAILFGIACDQIGHLRMCLIGLGISFIGCIGGIFAVDGLTLLISRFIEGAGFVSVIVSAPALISAASAPNDRHFCFGIWGAYVPIGVGLTMISSPAILPLVGWRGLWACVALVLAISSIALLLRRRRYTAPPPHSLDDHPLRLVHEVLAQPAPWLLALAFTTLALQHFTLIVWLPTFLYEQRALPPLTVAFLSFVMVVANAPGNLIGGVLIQRNYRRGDLITVASIVAGVADVGIFLDILPDAPRYLCCVILSFVGGLIPASVLSASAVIARTPRQIGTIQGLFVQGANLGQFAGPPLVALLVARSGRWEDALLLTGGAALGGIIIGLIIRRSET